MKQIIKGVIQILSLIVLVLIVLAILLFFYSLIYATIGFKGVCIVAILLGIVRAVFWAWET